MDAENVENRGRAENLTPFTSDRQPSGEAKSLGWKKRRAERLLTQEILRQMTEGEEMTDYVRKMRELAKKGNTKAIETINKGIEDDVQKIAITDADGNDAPIQIIQLPDNGRTNTPPEPKPE